MRVGCLNRPNAIIKISMKWFTLKLDFQSELRIFLFNNDYCWSFRDFVDGVVWVDRRCVAHRFLINFWTWDFLSYEPFVGRKNSQSLQKHWTWLSESWQKMGKKSHPIRFTTWCFTTRMEPKPASHMCEVWNPLMTEQGLLYLIWIHYEDLWSTWTRPNWSKPGFPSTTSSRCFESGFLVGFCPKYPSIKLQHHALEGLRGGWHQGSPIVVVLEWLDTVGFLDMYVQQGDCSHKDDT